MAVYRILRSFFLVALGFAVPVGCLVVAGCSHNSDTTTAQNPGGPGGQRMGGPGGQRMGGPGGGPGGPGGQGGRRGRRFAPVAVTATAPEIFQQKCQGCHGANGGGKRGPNITKLASTPDAELFKTIHDGKDRMPAFSKQMTDAQVTALVAYVKKLTPVT